MTQQGAAEHLGVTVATILNWELGRVEPRIQYIPALIRFLGYDPAPPLSTTLPQQLAAKRRTLGWTQKEAAQNLGGAIPARGPTGKTAARSWRSLAGANAAAPTPEIRHGNRFSCGPQSL